MAAAASCTMPFFVSRRLAIERSYVFEFQIDADDLGIDDAQRVH